MSDATLTIPFADEAGNGENRWIRLEQVEMPDEGVTMEEAAALIDELYGINACEDGLGNGGEAADEDALPEESEFLTLARERLNLDICEKSASATWETEVDVLRSHQDDGYSLQGERVEVGATTPMSKTVTESAEVNGASYDLQWPYGGDISVSGGATVKEVRGSTVNFAAPVRGRVRIRYRAAWERVKLTVRRGAAAHAPDIGSPGGILGAAGGASKSTREDDAAAVVAFWRDLAAECSLNRPQEDDQDIDSAEIERLCNRDTDWHVKGECWQTIETYNLCNCSGDEAKDAPDPFDEDAPCPDGVRPGSWLGTVRRFGEYVDCEGEDDEGLAEPEFYKEHCCKDNPRADLPRCRETREPYRGGEEIENGPEYWRNIYGESVRLTPVTPSGGNCGELVKIWDVPDICCKDALPLDLSETSMSIGNEVKFSLRVDGGIPPYLWETSAGVKLLGTVRNGERSETAFFQTGELGTWCESEIDVVDECGFTAKCEVENVDEAHWRQIGDVPSEWICGVPFAVGEYEKPPNPKNHISGHYWLSPVGKYRVKVRVRAHGPSVTDHVAPDLHFECEAGNFISSTIPNLLQEICKNSGSPAIKCAPSAVGCDCYHEKISRWSWIYIMERVEEVWIWGC